MELKYTTDGRKVAIVGKLNAQETIVQEIFVTESGAEIPQGENFVVRSLLEEPAKSWKVKQLEDEERNYQSKKGQYDREIKILRDRQGQLIEDLKAKVQSLKLMNQNLSIESMDPVFNFLTNQYTHVVCGEYGDYKIVEMDKFHTGNSYGLRLMSIYGDDKGDLLFRINEYHDGSGGHKTFVPFKSYADAVLHLSEALNSKEKIGLREIEIAKKYGITLSAEKIEAARLAAIAVQEYNIETCNKNAENYRKEIETINEKYKP